MRKKISGTPQGTWEELKKATTEIIFLHALQKKNMYSYEMMKYIEKESGGKIKYNTLYQAAYRLQDLGYVDVHDRLLSKDNRVQIVLEITDSGREYFDQIIECYVDFTSTLNMMLGIE